MSPFHQLRLFARKFGLEVTRYNPKHSQAARMAKLLEYYKIDTVLDVGANDGGYGKELRAGGYKLDILSFEPTSDAYEKLCRVTSKDAHWHVADRMALGANDGEAEINVAGNSTSSSIFQMEHLHQEAAPESKYIAVETINVHRLDSISHPVFNAERSIHLKIDTQGYEGEVLAGAENSLNFVQSIQLELSLVPLYHGQMLYKDLIELLDTRGFILWNIIPGFTDGRTGQMLQMDGVFVKNPNVRHSDPDA